MCMCVYVYIYIFTYLYVYVYIYIYIRIICMYINDIYIYICIHIQGHIIISPEPSEFRLEPLEHPERTLAGSASQPLRRSPGTGVEVATCR